MNQATIPSVVHSAARRFGSMEAAVSTAERVTFAEMDVRVRVRARALIASGVSPGDIIAIWAPNSIEWMAISFAVYAVGAVLVPINTRFKRDEAAQILRTVGARLVFTVTDFLDTDYIAQLMGMTEFTLGEVVVMSGTVASQSIDLPTFLDRSRSVPAGAVDEREHAIGPGDPSDIIFTSGTTGAPKGAVLNHRASISTYLQWTERIGLRRGDRLLLVYPFFHAAGLKAGILAAFLRGVTVVPQAVFDVPLMMRTVAQERITYLPGPPTVFQSILSHPDLATFDLSSLRLVTTGAATVPVELIERMRTELQLDSIVTAYGLTESHGTATSCLSTDSAATIAGTVGRPLDGVDLRIVDDRGLDVGGGGIGEVWLRGFNVTDGYFGDPEATRETIADGWLRTGDVGFVGSDGYLRLVDRKKDLFIVGGFNVVPAEVERVILLRNDVAQVAVVPAPDVRLGEVGAAFVVPWPGRLIDVDELTSWCRERMANYKVPRHVRLVDALPVTASGKVQKFVLRELARRLSE